jgi:radical SAM/Cys-rich protein
MRFEEQVIKNTGEALHPESVSIIQVNTGLRCNQECKHCHHEASPLRKETMRWCTMHSIIKLSEHMRDLTIDITGGSPELNPHLREFIRCLYTQGHYIKLRSNLTLLSESEYSKLMFFLRDHKVHIVGSLPCYTEENVNTQRGSGVFEKSIRTLKMLNSLGYGRDDSLRLTLVYNPLTADLPPDQHVLEEDYRRILEDKYNVVFSDLITITNMPIGRFLKDIKKQGVYEDYIKRLKGSFNKGTIPYLMCRKQITIGWDGRIYDCDFNLALKLPVDIKGSKYIRDYSNADDMGVLLKRRIRTGEHCFGCTAGHGSSCTGVLV